MIPLKLISYALTLAVLKSCLDVQTYSNAHADGEYSLQISYPICNQTVQIFCADMATSQPLEYLTLKAGSTNNFSKKNYVGSVKQSEWASTETAFSKVIQNLLKSFLVVNIFLANQVI